MIAEGNIDVWAEQFPIDQIPTAIQLILNSWESFKVPDELHEVPLTRKFCVHLQNHKNRSIHVFRIWWESNILNKEGEELGRIDLLFSQGLNEDVYFSIECNRLLVNFPSGFNTLASEYVAEGMFRYFNGQYASELDKGGMLGYVMDGNLDEAVQNVKEAINHRKIDLSMSQSEELKDSSLVPHKQVKETFHNYGPKGNFIIYHLFLPLFIKARQNKSN
jgi:hypothetical protein